MEFSMEYRNNHIDQQHGNPRHEQFPTRCHHYQKGFCSFGVQCRNPHIQPDVVNNTESEAEAAAATTVDSGSSRQAMSNTNSPTLSSSESGVKDIKDAETEAAGSSSQDVGIGEAATESCAICLDAIMERPNRREQIFGLLPNCNHCFCFRCIIKWRKRRVSSNVLRACPLCRQPSDYVYFSKTWFRTKETKDNFITKAKNRMLQTDCRYFRNGFSHCRLGNKCPYLHALANGTRLYPLRVPAPINGGGHIDLDMFLHIYTICENP
ncbi:unnamed protein product [Ceutorhynchus assimilis]|uniref:RING-type E3 ubiquitin transferase n=1 Tax=Ceutorhynchus assimilis TaxID=467358 RepID=A0A9N9QDU3_9CUCU|nr:unnamed protein product [Ceutorhynchus assimilis]